MLLRNLLSTFWEVVGKEEEEGKEEEGDLTTAGRQVGFLLLPLLFGGGRDYGDDYDYDYALGR